MRTPRACLAKVGANLQGDSVAAEASIEKKNLQKYKPWHVSRHFWDHHFTTHHVFQRNWSYLHAEILRALHATQQAFQDGSLAAWPSPAGAPGYRTQPVKKLVNGKVCLKCNLWCKNLHMQQKQMSNNVAPVCSSSKIPARAKPKLAPASNCAAVTPWATCVRRNAMAPLLLKVMSTMLGNLSPLNHKPYET